MPAFFLELGSASILTILTNSAGQLDSTSPTSLGDFGVPGTGLTFYLQAVLLNQTGQRMSSNREAVEIEPLSSGDFDLLQLAAGVVSGGSPDGIVVYLYENTNL